MRPNVHASASAHVRAPSRAPVWLLDDAPIMGGAEAFALRLCAWIRASDPSRRTLIACPPASELADRCASAGIEVLPVSYPLPAPRHAPAAARAVWRLRKLLSHAPEGTLLIANTARAQAYAILATRATRGRLSLVSVMHEQDSARRGTARWALRRFGGVAAVGDAGVRTYRDALSGTTVASVTNFLEPGEVERAAAARVPPPGSARPLVGVLSRMFAGKGIVELIDELARVPDAWSELRVAAPFQDAAYTASVRDRIAAHDLASRVSLLGGVTDVRAFIAGVDVVVVPSTATEGQPTVVLEALAHGRPVIVREHIWQSGYEGLPVRHYADHEELARALTAPAPPGVPAAALTARFDPAAVLATLERAARD